ncbi:hypothetical protein LINPERPRIM_LOCUS15004 [Linum perenne]
MEGEAQFWLQVMKESNDNLSWQQLVDGLHSRFRPTKFQDPFGELTKLEQTGTVREFQSRFERFLIRSGQIPETQQMSCFTSGLNPRIRIDVQAQQPRSDAIGLARLYEKRLCWRSHWRMGHVNLMPTQDVPSRFRD